MKEKEREGPNPHWGIFLIYSVLYGITATMVFLFTPVDISGAEDFAGVSPLLLFLKLGYPAVVGALLLVLLDMNLSLQYQWYKRNSLILLLGSAIMVRIIIWLV